MNPEETPTAVTEPAPIAAPEIALKTPSSNGEYLYFQKVLANIPFYVNRKPVMFEPLDRNMGVLKISVSDPLTDALVATAKAKRGGVVLIDAPIYEELKKKLPFNPLAQKLLRPKLQAFPNQAPRKAKPNEVAAAVDPISGRASGVGSAGGGGTDASAGTPASAPVPPPSAPGEFRPAVGKKNFKMPVLKKPTGNSLSGGIEEPEPTG